MWFDEPPSLALQAPGGARPAFTLIELLVVMGIMVIIATLGFLFLPNLNKNKGVPNATTQLEGWIRLTKNQALRDGASRGVRLIPDPNNPNIVTAIQYIGQPEPIAPQGMVVINNKPYQIAVMIMTQPPNGWAGPWPTYPYPQNCNVTATLVLLDMTNNNTPTYSMNWDDPANPSISIGDFLDVSASPNVVTRITQNPGPSALLPPAPAPLNGNARSTLTLDRAIDGTDQSPLILTSGFRVIRSARPLAGEPMLQMHKDAYIDLTTSSNLPPQNADGSYDILFNYSGQVAYATGGMIFLVVQHVDRSTDKLVVAIYTRTGKVTAVNWDDLSADPYSFARDGRGSGL
jgi:prepilin-type N-terminal cleavage/methylation domain-containing protein